MGRPEGCPVRIGQGSRFRRWLSSSPVRRKRRAVVRRHVWAAVIGVATVAFMTLVVILGVEHFGPIH
jgi:hypothetical protein